MKLLEIIQNETCEVLGDFLNLEVKSLACDTGCVREGSLFFCLKGEKLDGHNFAKLAVKKGAVAIVVEKRLDLNIVQVVVNDTRKAMAKFSANFYNNPQKNLKFVGVTGTNGKTTTTYLIESILNCAGKNVGVVGTIGVKFGGQTYPAHLTTPDSIEFFEILNNMKECGVEFVVMEVSAHAIFWDKLFGIKFEVGVLTNITQDHLDFFKTFDNYKKTKQSFISSKYCKSAVINAEDAGCLQVLNVNNNLPIVDCGFKNECDLFAYNIELGIKGTKFDLLCFDKLLKISTKLCGEFNVFNIMFACAVCKLLKIDERFLVEGIKQAKVVAGRFNVIDLGEEKNAVVDFAHTPDGLEKILKAVKKIAKNKVICVFGCGGNRDTLKRPIMGKIAGTLADFCVITSDNPRFENPLEIIRQIEKGMRQTQCDFVCIENRISAISCGLKHLNKGDVLVVCGKGAENYMEIEGKKFNYLDFDTIITESEKLKKEQK